MKLRLMTITLACVCLLIGMSALIVQAASVYDCGFEGYALGALTGQGTPAWGNSFTGWEGSGNVDNAQSYSGSQSAYVQGYQTSKVRLPSVTHAQWFEFAFRTNFGTAAGDDDDMVQVITTRGEVSDVQGIQMRVVKKIGQIELNTSSGWAPIAACPNQTWQTISFKHIVASIGVYNGNVAVYVNGDFVGLYSVASTSAYNGLQTIVYTATEDSWAHGGAFSIDDVHVGDKSQYITSVYDCSFEPFEGYSVGSLEGQGGDLAWGKRLTGWEGSGTVDNTQTYSGMQSANIRGYQTSTQILDEVSHAKWFEFALRTDFLEGSAHDDDVVQVITTRGGIGDVWGIIMRVVKKTAQIELSVGNTWVALAPCVNQTWYRLSFEHEISSGIYSGRVTVYLNGDSLGKYTVSSSSAYNGLQTFAFTTTEDSWAHGGNFNVDEVYIGEKSQFVPLQQPGPTFSPAGGNLIAPQNVTISYTDSAATICYTTDGSIPTATNGTQIPSGSTVLVDRPMTIRARAWINPLNSSAVNSATYAFVPLTNRLGGIGYANNVTVDGNLTEWSNSDFVPMDKIYDLFNSSEALLKLDVPQNGASYAAKWGPDNKLYVAVKVRDLQHSFTSDYADWFARDAAEIYVHTAGTGPFDFSAAHADAQQYVIGIKSGTTNQVWTALGGNKPIPTEAGFQAAGSVVGEWIYYEAALTAFQHFSLDGQGMVVSPLRAGQAIGLDATVVAHDGTYYSGMWSENSVTGKSTNYNNFAQHLLVTNGSIADAKTSVDSTGILCSGVVSAVFSDAFYIESTDRTYGIRVQKANHGLAVGQLVNVVGNVQTLDSGERYIYAAEVIAFGSGEIKPLGMTNKSLGGGDFGTVLGQKQSGVNGGNGLNNIGLLVKTTGLVAEKDESAGWFKIDDGSGVSVKVFGNIPVGNPYVTLTGISSCEKIDNAMQRVIFATSID